MKGFPATLLPGRAFMAMSWVSALPLPSFLRRTFTAAQPAAVCFSSTFMFQPQGICDGEILLTELHTGLTPQQSCLLRIIADPRMFSLKTDFSDRLSKRFPCTISNMMGQNYAKHMGLTLPSAARSSLILFSMDYLTHPSRACTDFVLHGAFFMLQVAEEKGW